jgi:class 3 adenylate cyclase
VTLVFADIVGFSTLARKLSPAQLLELLDTLFSSFDALAERHGVEKIKTIGDAYFAVAGLRDRGEASASRAAAMSLALRRDAAITGRRCGLPLQLRIGLHTGPVVAGVLGRTRYAFDVWGDAVNVASRLQGAAPVGAILVSEATRRHCPPSFRFGPAHTIPLRGCGPVVACRLHGRLPVRESLDDLGGDGLR